MRARRAGAEALQDPSTLAQLGILVLRDFIGEAEEAHILRALRATGESAVVPWTPRDGGGMHANFGPSYKPNSGFKVDRRACWTELPEVLSLVRTRAEALLGLPRVEPSDIGEIAKAAEISFKDAAAVRDALRTYAMSPATRAGRQGALSQAFVQRYRDLGSPRKQYGGDAEVRLELPSKREAQDAVRDASASQALGMHFDSRTENAEVVFGLSLGAEPGCIFFSRRGPKKSLPFPLRLARALQERGDGLLVDLPRRSLYLFYGFARYHLRHGVPWPGTLRRRRGAAGAGGPGNGYAGPAYDRLTVTFRSVPLPRRSSALGAGNEESKKQQRRSEEWMDGQAFHSAESKPEPALLSEAAPELAAGGWMTKKRGVFAVGLRECPWRGGAIVDLEAEEMKGEFQSGRALWRGRDVERAPVLLDLQSSGEESLLK